MKLYVIPVETECNGNCAYCITRTRKHIDSEFLSLDNLNKSLNIFKNLSAIEITGGGEPLLNHDISEIVRLCNSFARTRLYTNGDLILNNIDITKNLDELCISRAHHDDKINKMIMGVEYNINHVVESSNCNIKLSLMLNKRAINNYESLIDYCKWAKGLGVKKVVVRELVVQDDCNYFKIFQNHFMSIQDVVSDIDERLVKVSENLYKYNSLLVEFEVNGCAKGNANLIIRSDGQLYSDWDNNILLDDENFVINYLKKISTTSTCLGRQVSALIMKEDKVLGVGSNSGSMCKENKFCNRVVLNRQEDYSCCLCTHAEINAINDSKVSLEDATVYLYGHHMICDDCKSKAKEVGIKKIVVINNGEVIML